MSREERGRRAAVEGFANEHIAVGILMKRYQNVSLVDLPLSRYDIIIALKKDGEQEDIIRAQVKTVRNVRRKDKVGKQIVFKGGTRAGADRTYKSDIKEYRIDTTIADLVIGIDEDDSGRYTLYFVPTCLVEELNQNSISLSRIEMLRENYEILENCKNREYVLDRCKSIIEKFRRRKRNSRTTQRPDR
jgi:hypothetical protein